MVAESCRRWRCDGDMRKMTLRLESWQRRNGMFEMLERDGGVVPARARRSGSSPAGAQRLAAFRCELRWSDEVVAQRNGLVRKREKKEIRVRVLVV